MPWVFGYGSIIWRPSFPYIQNRPALLPGWRRRFWQGSPDHRGTLQQPGRVVTLVEEKDANCQGMAFRISEGDAAQVIADLDERESGGYIRMYVDIEFERDITARALTYIALPNNDNFLGPAPLASIVSQIRASHGASGTNVEYVLELASVLRRLAIEDDEVFKLESRLKSSQES